jgi:tRNA dimethylallyltransferase
VAAGEPADRRVAVIVAGPTATGKSSLALALAEAFDGVVINADALQVYTGLRILTARPDRAATARAPHALYGVLAPDDPCSAGRWRAMALRKIDTAHRAGRLPVLVGGSGLYLRALEYGLSPIPPIPPEIHKAALKRHRELGGPAFHAALAERDPAVAARLNPRDQLRLVRAWEVLEATGRSIGKWQAMSGEPGLAYRRLRLILLPPRPRLYEACDRRFEAMMAAGAPGEVRRLLDRGLDPDLPIMKAVGVRELARLQAGEWSADRAVAAAQQATRNYAKRQVTWLRTQMLAGTPEQYAERIATAPPWADPSRPPTLPTPPTPPADAASAANPGDLVHRMAADTWVIHAQYSESLLPRIFRILRDFLLTTPG